MSAGVVELARSVDARGSVARRPLPDPGASEPGPDRLRELLNEELTRIARERWLSTVDEASGRTRRRDRSAVGCLDCAQTEAIRDPVLEHTLERLRGLPPETRTERLMDLVAVGFTVDDPRQRLRVMREGPRIPAEWWSRAREEMAGGSYFPKGYTRLSSAVSTGKAAPPRPFQWPSDLPQALDPRTKWPFDFGGGSRPSGPEVPGRPWEPRRPVPEPRPPTIEPRPRPPIEPLRPRPWFRFRFRFPRIVL